MGTIYERNDPNDPGNRNGAVTAMDNHVARCAAGHGRMSVLPDTLVIAGVTSVQPKAVAVLVPKVKEVV